MSDPVGDQEAVIFGEVLEVGGIVFVAIFLEGLGILLCEVVPLLER